MAQLKLLLAMNVLISFHLYANYYLSFLLKPVEKNILP